MKYAQINQQNEVLLFPCSLPKLVSLSIIASVDATNEELALAGIVLVESCTTLPPEDEYLKDLRAIRQEDGTWKEEWVRLETSEEHRNAAIIRKTQQMLRDRGYLLSISDWTQMPDSPVTNKQEWAVYRQALRDLTDQPGFPYIQFPQRPE